MGRGGMMKSMVVVVIMVMVMKGTAAETFTVGDDDGWTVPSSLDFYSSWVAKQSFAVGDTLVFNFLGTHTVAKVTSKEAYDKCNSTLDENANVFTKNPTEFTLTSEGEVFFFCTIKGHCPSGQKLAINKLAINVTATGSGSNPGPTGSHQSPPQSPPDKDSARKPVAVTLATLSLFLGALVLAFGYF